MKPNVGETFDSLESLDEETKAGLAQFESDPYEKAKVHKIR